MFVHKLSQLPFYDLARRHSIFGKQERQGHVMWFNVPWRNSVIQRRKSISTYASCYFAWCRLVGRRSRSDLTTIILAPCKYLEANTKHIFFHIRTITFRWNNWLSRYDVRRESLGDFQTNTLGPAYNKEFLHPYKESLLTTSFHFIRAVSFAFFYSS